MWATLVTGATCHEVLVQIYLNIPIPATKPIRMISLRIGLACWKQKSKESSMHKNFMLGCSCAFVSKIAHIYM